MCSRLPGPQPILTDEKKIWTEKEGKWLQVKQEKESLRERNLPGVRLYGIPTG